MTWNIVSDSSCDMRISDFQSEKVRFEIVPLRIQVGEQEFIDNDSLKIPEMLEAMAAEKAASSTACPSPAAFARAFEPGDCTVCFTISGNLSGTYNAAVMAREMVLEDHPEKKVCIIDSKATAGAMALLIRRAKALMEADISPVPEWVLDDRNQEGYMVDICLPERMPTAFACNSDLTASALVKTLEARGYRIPEDISVVGFDNYLYDGLCNIKITSYEVNVEEMVRAALKDIVRQIQHGRELPDSLRQNVQIISGRLVVKDSVKVIR